MHKKIWSYKGKQVHIDLDGNNLYGWGISRYLPHGEFKCVKNIDSFDLNSISKNSLYRYILKVDLEYPDELHNLHNNYSLAPERLEITYDILSNYCKKNADKYSIKVGGVKKLVPNLSKKTNYTVHYIKLQLYLSLGMKLIKIHKILKFKQSDWIKKYIEFNTDKGKNAKNEFEKSLFKLMNNSAYGKTMENLRKRINVRLANNAKDLNMLANQLLFLKNILVKILLLFMKLNLS